MLAILNDGTVLLNGDTDGQIRWIAPGDQQGGKLVHHEGLGKEWQVVSGYSDGLLTGAFEGVPQPDTFIPIRNGQLLLNEKTVLPIRARLAPSTVCPIVRHRNTLVWIENPDRGVDLQADKRQRLVTFNLDRKERAEVILETQTGGTLLMYDGQTAVTTNGRFLDAATGKDLVVNSDTPGISGDQATWYEELSQAVSPRAGQGSAITVRNRTLYYVSVARKDNQVSDFRIMAGGLGRPLTKPSCLLAFPYCKCCALFGKSQVRPEHLLSQQCIPMDDGISVWNGTQWVNLPWVMDANRDRSPAGAPPDKPHR